MSRTKHPEYATPPATVHPTDIARGLVDPDEAARRWNAHDALVALARGIVGYVEGPWFDADNPEPEGRASWRAMRNKALDILGAVDGPK